MNGIGAVGMGGGAACAGMASMATGVSNTAAMSAMPSDPSMVCSNVSTMSITAQSQPQGPSHADLIAAFALSLLLKGSEDERKGDGGLSTLLGLAALGAAAGPGISSFSSQSISVSSVCEAYSGASTTATCSGSFSAQA